MVDGPKLGSRSWTESSQLPILLRPTALAAENVLRASMLLLLAAALSGGFEEMVEVGL